MYSIGRQKWYLHKVNGEWRVHLKSLLVLLPNTMAEVHLKYNKNNLKTCISHYKKISIHHAKNNSLCCQFFVTLSTIAVYVKNYWLKHFIFYTFHFTPNRVSICCIHTWRSCQRSRWQHCYCNRFIIQIPGASFGFWCSFWQDLPMLYKDTTSAAGNFTAVRESVQRMSMSNK
jgi:hypothetical protein